MNELENLLRESRPQLTALELDQVKQRARTQARKTNKTDIYGWKGIRIMRPRLVATSLLVAGMFFTGSGATLAVISDSQSAAVVQYPETCVPGQTTGPNGENCNQTPPPQQCTEGQTTGPNGESCTTSTTTPPADNTQPPAGQEVLGENFSGGTPKSSKPNTSGNEVLGQNASGNAPAAANGNNAPASVQANRQLGTTGGGKELPFTGFAAIPVLLIGILMLSTGVALRRTMRRNEA